MSQVLDGIDGQILDRLDRVVSELGSTRARVVERALRHYLAHVVELDLEAAGRPPAPAREVDWAVVKSTLIAAHCPYPSCPHAGNCPIELCPL
jgi:hypothetical protein